MRGPGNSGDLRARPSSGTGLHTSSRPPTSKGSLSADTVPPLRSSATSAAAGNSSSNVSPQMYLLSRSPPLDQPPPRGDQVEVTVNVPLARREDRDYTAPTQMPDYGRTRESQAPSRVEDPPSQYVPRDMPPGGSTSTRPSGGVYNSGSIVAEPGQPRITGGGYNTGSIVAERGQPNVGTPSTLGGGGFAAAANSYLGSTATPFARSVAPFQTYAPTPPGSVAPYQPNVRRESPPENATHASHAPASYLLQASPEPSRSTMQSSSPVPNSPASLSASQTSSSPDQSPGISRASGLSSSGGGGRRPYCVVCMSKPEEVAVDPCGHMSMCSGCASMVKECPVCRSPINKLLKIFVVR